LEKVSYWLAALAVNQFQQLFAAASMNPRASQLEALISLSSSLPEILCWIHVVLGM